MSLRLVWSDGADTILRRLCAEGADLDEIASTLRKNHETVLDRVRQLGARTPSVVYRAPPLNPRRAPLAAGDRASWQALTAGTLLAGAAFGAETAA